MEWLANILTSDKVGIVLVALFVFVIIAIVLMKMGYLSVNTGKVRLGQDLSTRSLIQSQFEYVNARLENEIPVKVHKLLPDNDPYRTKWIMSRIEDVFQRAIIFNNMNSKAAYITAKQELVRQAVLKRVATENYEIFSSADFSEWLDSLTKEIITTLVDMKEAGD